MLAFIKTALENLGEAAPAMFIGGLIGSFLTTYRNKLTTLKYKVIHERVALANDNSVFPKVSITCQDKEVLNLFICSILLKNTGTKDFSDLTVKFHTEPSTELLTKQVILEGIKESLSSIDELGKEFLLPVFNREQTLYAQFLTTVTNQIELPKISVETLHKGLKLEHEPNYENVFGIPIKKLIPLVLVISFITVILSSLFIPNIWIACGLCMIIALYAQYIAASIWRLGSRISKTLLG